MEVSIKGRNVDDILNELGVIETRQIPFATSRTINALGWGITGYRGKRGYFPRILPKFIDRPRYKNPFYFEKSDKRNLTGYIRFKDQNSRVFQNSKVFPARYYRPQVFGGQREAKGHEKALRRMGILGSNEFTVPGKRMRLDRYGNLSGATYSKILADVLNVYTGGDDIGSGYGQRTTKRGKKRYFYDPNLRPRGIWVRQSRKVAYPALVFVTSAPQYKIRFPMEELGDRYITKNYRREFRKAMEYALKTARRR